MVIARVVLVSIPPYTLARFLVQVHWTLGGTVAHDRWKGGSAQPYYKAREIQQRPWHGDLTLQV
jgi:hypothetical protein